MQAAADGVQLYSAATIIREVHGTVVVSQFPTWEDLLVLNDFGVWESFVLRSESSVVLAATLSKRQLIAVIGDETFRAHSRTVVERCR